MTLKEKVLTSLLCHVGEAVSGQALAETCGVSKNAVWKVISSLKEDGQEIEAVTNKGYTLKSDDVFCKEGVKKFFKGDMDVYFFSETDSTNTRAKILSETVNEALIVADCQNKGKGRMGRSFSSPKGKGAYFSLLLRPNLYSNMNTFLTITAAVAAYEVISSLTGLNLEIKWVNDILLNGKKIVGILCEAQTSFETGELSYVIVGIGINVSEPDGGYSQEIKNVATALNIPINRNRLVAETADRFIDLLEVLKNDPKEILGIYRKHLSTIGKNIIVSGGSIEPFDAVAVDLTDDGALIIETKDGERKTVSFGEVSVKATK